MTPIEAYQHLGVLEAVGAASGHANAGLDPSSSGPALGAIPLFHATWLFATGIAVTGWLWVRPSLVLVALAAVAVLCGVAALRAQSVLWMSLGVFWLLLGAWCAEMEPHPAPAPALAMASDGLLRTVEGTVVGAGPVREQIEQNLPEHDEPATVESQHTQSIDLSVSMIEVVNDADDVQAPGAGGARLTVRWPTGTSPSGSGAEAPFRCGERIRAVAQLRRPEVYHDPGVWSRQDFLLGQGITSTATVNVARIERLGPAGGLFLACRLGGLQHASSSRLLALPAAMRRLPAPLRLSQDDAVMLAAMVTGDRTYLTRSLRVGFERTGSFHMLVVSGFHLAIVAGCILWTARSLCIPRVPATLVTILASFGYALFTGFATPVQRSLWMVSLYLLGRLVYRERSPLNTIGFAALCLLAASPRSIFESSFQMTLLAVVAIGGIATPLLQCTIQPYIVAARDLRLTALDGKLSPRLAQFRSSLRMIAMSFQAVGGGPIASSIAWRTFPWVVRFFLRVIELIVVSCVVELAMTLPMAMYFHRITIFALPVNLFILPLLAILMPAALLTLLALYAWPAAAVVPGMVVAVFLHFGVALVHLFGSLALGDVRISGPVLWQSAAFCALLGAAIALARFAFFSWSRWPRRLVWIALLLAALVAIAPRPIQHPSNALLVEAIDVGQGDSLLLITPDGKTLLVDAGGFGGGPRQAPQEFDIGEEVVSQALWARGIRRLDAVALSHAHSDHMGGMQAVVRNFHPRELWVGNNPPTAPYRALLDEAAGLNVRLRSLRAGDAFPLGSARVNVLAPFANYQPEATPTNNDSMVLRVAYGATSVLLEGDAEAPIEQAMLSEPDLASTLLKVGHHGSITSSIPDFLAAVAPRWAVISCGLHNRYGHPRMEVLAELQGANVRTLSTDLNGASCFELDGKTVALEPSCGRR